MIKNKENGKDVLFIITYMILQWLVLIGIFLKIILSFIKTMFHYYNIIAKSSNDTDDDELTIEKFIQREIVKLTGQTSHEKGRNDENENENERMTLLLCSLNHFALADIDEDYKKEKSSLVNDRLILLNHISRTLNKEYASEIKTFNSKRVLKDLLMDESEKVNLYKERTNRLLTEIHGKIDFLLEKISKIDDLTHVFLLLNKEKERFIHEMNVRLERIVDN